MSNFSRRLALRRQAEASKQVARQVAAQARAGQVARSSVPIGDADVDLAGGIELGQDVAVTVDYHNDALLDQGRVTDGVLDALPDLAGDIEWSDGAAGGASDAAGGAWGVADDAGYEASRAEDLAAEGVADASDAESQAAAAEAEVADAQAAASQAAADALDAAAASAAASQAAADAKLEAEAASSAAAQAAQDATDKSAAAEAAAKAYAEAQAAAAEAAAVAEASGDASAKAAAAEAAAKAAAAADASAKAAAAEAAAKADAAAAQATADAAAGAASDAQDAADSVRFLAEGLYQAIPSVTAPTASPSGPLKQGDMWFQIGATGTNVEGKFIGVQVWDGTQWQPREMLADSLVVVGPDGVVRVANGKVTAEALAVDALDFKTATGMDLTAGTVTGATVRTGESGQRLQLDVDGLKAFSSTGVVTALLRADSGGLELSGNLTAGRESGGVSYVTSVGSSGFSLTCFDGSVVDTFYIDQSIGRVRFNTFRAVGSGEAPQLEFMPRTSTPGNVFALKSQLDAWHPIDGTHAWVTSEGREYVRAGGAWGVAYGDTGWRTISLSAGWSGTALARSKNGVVYLTGAIINSGFSNGSYEQVASLPSGIAAPPSSFVSSYQGTGGPLRNIQVQANGVFYCRTTAASSQSIPFNFSYPE